MKSALKGTSAAVSTLSSRPAGDTKSRILRGRGSDVARSSKLLARVADVGHGGAIVVAGPPGIGKTALVDELLQQATTFGFSSARYKADEADQIAPMALLLLALRSGAKPLLSRRDFETLAPLRDHPLWLIDRVIAILEERAARSPLLIALDDVQWADRLTLSCLRIMPARLAGLPIVWLIAARNGDSSIEKAIDFAKGDLPEVLTLALGPLCDEAIEQIVIDRLGAPPNAHVRRLLQGSGGNPFLAVELLNGIVDDGSSEGAVGIPTRLRSGVRRRLEALSPQSRRVVQAGAVFARPFSLDDAHAVLGGAEPELARAIQEAIELGILQSEQGLLAFKHDLLRQATYEDIAPLTRDELHHAILQHLVASGRDRIEAVPHVIASSTGDHAGMEILLEASRSIATCMPAVAARLAQQAFSMITETDPRWAATGASVLGVLAQCRHGRQVVALADRLTSRDLHPDAYAAIQARTAWPLWYMGHMGEIVRRAELGRTREGLSDLLRAEMDAFRALALSSGSDYHTALETGIQALDQSRRVGSIPAEVTSLRALAETATNDGRYDDALAFLRQIPSPEERAKTAVQEILLLQLLDRYQESAELLRDAHRRMAQGGGPRAADIAFAQLWHDYTSGNFDDAEADALTLINDSDEVHENTYQIEGRLVFSRLRQLRGDFVGAKQHISLAIEDEAGQSEMQTLLAFMARTFVGANEGDFTRVLPFVREFVHAQSVLHRWRWQPGWLVVAARTAVRAGDVELAGETVTLAEQLAARNPNVVTIVGILEHLRGLLHHDLKALQRATRLLERSPRRFIFADALADYGDELLARGHRNAATAILEKALERFLALGAKCDADRVGRSIQKARARGRHWKSRPGKPLSGWESLTRTERRVARLIAEGHTNRSAAGLRDLSANTIATHLRTIFGKLGVNSRVQLTRTLFALGPHEQGASPG